MIRYLECLKIGSLSTPINIQILDECENMHITIAMKAPNSIFIHIGKKIDIKEIMYLHYEPYDESLYYFRKYNFQ